MAKVVRIPGVSFYKPTGKWRAYRSIGGKQKGLGYFATQAEAAEHLAFVEQEDPKPIKEPTPRAQSPEPATPSLVEKMVRANPHWQASEGPRNQRSISVSPDMWKLLEDHGHVEQWFDEGLRWQFVRRGRLALWDAGVAAHAKKWEVSVATAENVFRRGFRKTANHDPAWARCGMLRDKDDAMALGVADLV